MDLDTTNSKTNYNEDEKLNSYTWKEIKDNKNWIVINDMVYDVSNFMKKTTFFAFSDKINLNWITRPFFWNFAQFYFSKQFP